MTIEKLLVAGHSHTIAFGCENIITADGVPAIVPTSDPRFVGLAGDPGRGERYLDEIVKRSADHIIVLVWRGDQHYVRFLFRHEKAFDFFLSSEPHLKASGPVVPEEAVAAYFQTCLFGLDTLLRKLSAVGAKKVIVCGTPPPKNDDAFIREILSQEPYWRDLATRHNIDFDTVEITPGSLMYKLWAVSQRVFAEQAAQHGVLFAPVPRSVTTDDGFLRPEFWGSDLIHAWGDYGRIMRDYVYGVAVNAGWADPQDSAAPSLPVETAGIAQIFD